MRETDRRGRIRAKRASDAGDDRTLSRRTTLAVVVACAALGLGNCDDASKKKPPPPLSVEVTKPVTSTVPVHAEWVGTLNGFLDAKVTAQVTGYLQSQDYKEGSFVEKGAPIFTIDPRPFQATLDQAIANLEQAIANQQLSEITLQRLIPLAADDVVSQQDLDDARQKNLANIATVKANKASVHTAQINLGFTKIISPIKGLAGIREASIGDLVGPSGNMQTLTWVATVDPIYAEFPIAETQYLETTQILEEHSPDKAGDNAKSLQLYLSDGSLWPFPGVYAFANNHVDPETGTLIVKALFPNPTRILRPGQYARVRATVKEIHDALQIPLAAVQQLQGGYFVATVGAGNKVAVKSVTPGQKNGNLWVIDDGLTASDVVIVTGASKVKAGQVVTPKQWSPTSSSTSETKKSAGAAGAPDAGTGTDAGTDADAGSGANADAGHDAGSDAGGGGH
jgi:RND family efflux transporter MFP subunit